MTRHLASQFFFRVSYIAAAICLVTLPLSVLAHETETTTADPGFRPPSEYAPAFLDSLDTVTIAVYPTIVRRADRTAHSFASQGQIIDLLNKEDFMTAIAGRHRFDFGRLQGRSQWDLFLNDMQRIADVQRSQAFTAEYLLIMEFLFPVNNQAIFGIQCYVLDKTGENVFSFLLNSHHQLFVDANLIAQGTSEAARAKLMAKATQAGVTALKQQIEQARKVEAGPVTHDSPIDESDLVGAMQGRNLEKQLPCTGPRDFDYPINELPMFGKQKKTADQKRADEEYIKYMTRHYRSRAAGADATAKLGWNTYYSGDCSTAIKRFNQAWLLDPDNQLALWGFASICVSRGQYDEAVRYLELAIEKGPEEPKLREDYDYTMKRLSASSHNQQPLQ